MTRRVLPFERRFVSAVSLEAPPRSVVVAVIRGTGLKRKLEEFRALPCWESVSRADPLFCRSLRIRPTPVSHADALFLLSLSPFSPKQRDFLGKWPRSCPKWQRVVNACLRAFLPLTVARHCWRLLASFHSSASSTYHESHPRLNKASQISLSLKQIFLSKRYRVIELINWRRDSPSRISVGTWILEYNQIVSLPR